MKQAEIDDLVKQLLDEADRATATIERLRDLQARYPDNPSLQLGALSHRGNAEEQREAFWRAARIVAGAKRDDDE